MEKYGYTYMSHSPDWTVSLPGIGVSAHGPCFSVPAQRLCIGRIMWIAGMFECAVRCAVRSVERCVRRAAKFFYTRVSVVRATCRFRL